MKKLMLTAAAFVLAVPVLTLAAAAQPDRANSTFQQRAHGQHGPQNRDQANRPQANRHQPAPQAQAPQQAAPQQAAPQRAAQDRGRDRDRDQSRDRRGGDNRWSGNRGDDRRSGNRDDNRRSGNRNDNRWSGDRGDNRDNRARPGNDRRPDYRPGNNHRPGGFDNNRGRRDWSSWRNEHRRNWNRPSRRFHGPTYHRPSGWYYRRWSFGDFLPSLFWSSQYWISNYAMYGLPVPPPGATWVRYGDDAVLIDRFTGEVIDVEYDFFY